MGNFLSVKDGSGNWITIPAFVGDKGDPGTNGKDGTNGVSCTHNWNGTTLTVTSASGTSSANLKGDKGDRGSPGSSGVYVGTTEPTDENIDVWIDPSGTNTGENLVPMTASEIRAICT